MTDLRIFDPTKVRGLFEQLQADLADSRRIAREQEDAHVAANLRNTHLQERITQLETFLNRCYEESRAPYAEEMDNEHVPMPEGVQCMRCGGVYDGTGNINLCPRCRPPPVDNIHVAEGCEQFGSVPQNSEKQP